MDSFKNQQQQQESKLHFLDYWRIIRIRKAIIITVFLITAIIATAVTFILPESYSATTRIEVNSQGSDIPSLTASPDASSTIYDPFFIQTTFEIIQSQVVLSNVVNQLNLNVAWGKKYYGGETLKTTETMEVLKKRMSLQPVRSTKLIAITVYSDDKNECAQLANAIAGAYQEYRLELRRQLTTGGLKALQDQYAESESKIQVTSTNVDYLRGKLKILDNDPNQSNPSATLTSQMLQTYNEEMIDGEKVYKQLKTQLDELKALDGTKLRDVLPTVTGDTMLSDLLGKLHASQQQFATLTNDYGLADLHITRVQSMIDELNHEIDGRVTGIMLGLDSEVKSKEAALNGLMDAVETAKSNDQKEQERGQPYWEEKRNLARQLDFQRILASKIEEEKLDLQIPKNSLVEIIDAAVPGDRPVKPNKPLNIVIGAIFGVFLGAVFGSIAAWVVTRLGKRPNAAAPGAVG